MEVLFNIAAFIFVLTVIVFIHEYGHYYIARINGVKVEAFSIGFGKELFGWNDKHGTRWKICAIPMGGYVKMFGDINPASVPDDEQIKAFTKEEEEVAFHSKKLSQKTAIVSAGPIANFILSIVILSVLFAFVGKSTTLPEVSAIAPDSAAEAAGLQEGDMILEIDGEGVRTFADLQRIIGINTGTEVGIKLDRGGEIVNVAVTPRITEREDAFGNPVKTPLLGVMSTAMSYEKLSLVKAPIEAVRETYNIGKSTLIAVGQMIVGKRSATEISGPIGIAKYSGQSAKRGVETLFWFMAVLSINLGLINLFPIPVLDGGHLLYYGIEAVRGKPMADKYQQYGFKIGIALVATLAIFAIVNDILKLF